MNQLHQISPDVLLWSVEGAISVEIMHCRFLCWMLNDKQGEGKMLPPSPTGWILKKVTDMEEGEAKKYVKTFGAGYLDYVDKQKREPVTFDDVIHQMQGMGDPNKVIGRYYLTAKDSLYSLCRSLGKDPEQCYLIIRK